MSAFYQRFQESARKFPNNIALEIQRQETVERVTFAELTQMAESVANWLSTRVPRDARVAILAANHPRWVAAYLGIIAAGTNGGSTRHGFPRRPGKEVADRQRSVSAVLRCEASSGGGRGGRGTQRKSGDDFGGGRAGARTHHATSRSSHRTDECGTQAPASPPISIPSSPPALPAFSPSSPPRTTWRRCSTPRAPRPIPRASCSPTPTCSVRRILCSPWSRSVRRMRCSEFCPCFTSSRRWRIYSCLYSTARASSIWRR